VEVGSWKGTWEGKGLGKGKGKGEGKGAGTEPRSYYLGRISCDHFLYLASSFPLSHRSKKKSIGGLSLLDESRNLDRLGLGFKSDSGMGSGHGN